MRCLGGQQPVSCSAFGADSLPQQPVVGDGDCVCSTFSDSDEQQEDLVGFTGSGQQDDIRNFSPYAYLSELLLIRALFI